MQTGDLLAWTAVIVALSALFERAVLALLRRCCRWAKGTDVRAEHLYKRFGDKPVLENVSLTVPEGAVLCLMAPSGWGKTTLLRCMAGLEKPDSGTVRDVPERIGYVFQEDRLCGHMSAVENVRLATDGAWTRKPSGHT